MFFWLPRLGLILSCLASSRPRQCCLGLGLGLGLGLVLVKTASLTSLSSRWPHLPSTASRVLTFVVGLLIVNEWWRHPDIGCHDAPLAMALWVLFSMSHRMSRSWRRWHTNACLRDVQVHCILQMVMTMMKTRKTNHRWGVEFHRVLKYFA